MLAETTVEIFATSNTEVAPSIRSWKTETKKFRFNPKEINHVELIKKIIFPREKQKHT